MYKILVGELAKKKITNRALAKTLDIHENTVANKLCNGSFSVDEAIVIRDEYFEEQKIEELFATEQREGWWIMILIIDEEVQGQTKEFAEVNEFKKAVAGVLDENVETVTIKKRVAKSNSQNVGTKDVL